MEHFRAHEVKLSTLRRAADRLREEFATLHPFATDRIHLEADKADVFLVVMRDSAKEEKDRALLSLTTDNYVLEEIIKRNLVPGLVFDPQTHVARKWTPRPNEFPDIIIDPKVAYGQPIVESGVPTSVLLASWEAEKDLDEVAFWHNVKSSEVRRAVDFEKFLDDQKVIDRQTA